VVGSDQGATNLFRVASGEPYPFLFKNDVFARWLISDSANYLDANHTFICISATMNGTQFGHVIFDIDFIQRANTTDSTYTRLTNIEFRDCTISSFGTNTRYKLYANSFDGVAFVTQATPIQPVPNGDILVSWYDFRYGANSTQSANNANIFYELTFNAVANSLAIDGEDLAIKFDSDTIPQLSVSNFDLTMKNMNIYSNYVINLKTTTVGGYLLKNVSIFDSKFSAGGSAQACSIKFLSGDSLNVHNCQLTYAGIECDNNVYITNNRFYGSTISNSTGNNVHILNNYCKAQVNDTSFIYIGSTLEPQQWEVKGNTFLKLSGGSALMFNVGTRDIITNTITNCSITCIDNFGGEFFDTEIKFRGTGASYASVIVGWLYLDLGRGFVFSKYIDANGYTLPISTSATFSVSGSTLLKPSFVSLPISYGLCLVGNGTKFIWNTGSATPQDVIGFVISTNLSA